MQTKKQYKKWKYTKTEKSIYDGALFCYNHRSLPACGRDHSPAQASPAKRTGCGAPPLRPCGLSPAPRRRPRCTAPIPRAPSHTAEDTCSALCVVSHDSPSRRNTQKQEKSAPSFIPLIAFHPPSETVEPSKASGTSGIRSK